MAMDLMDSVKGLLTPEVVGKAAEATGESPESTSKALHGAVPTVFAGFAQSASAPGGAARLMGMLTTGGATGQGLMSKVLGDRGGAVSDALAKHSGIKSSSASHLLTLAFPMVAGVLGKQILSNKLSPGGLSQLLSRHNKAIADDPHTPPGLAGALGMSSLSEIGGASGSTEEPHVSSVRTPPVTEAATGGVARTVEPSGVSPRKPRWSVLLPALALCALAVWGIFGLTKSHAPKVGVTEPQPTMPGLPSMPTPQAPKAPNVPAAPKVEAPSVGPIALPGGKTLDVAPNGPEAEMAHYLGDSATPLPHTFAFDNLNFETGTAKVTPDSTKTIDGLATMLQAYPSARVRLEGHTDSVGDPAANQALSKERAEAIEQMLTARGISSDRIETTGKSEEAPVAKNGSQEGRARNRRVDIVLLDR